jgi:hypothetical protein
MTTYRDLTHRIDRKIEKSLTYLKIDSGRIETHGWIEDRNINE